MSEIEREQGWTRLQHSRHLLRCDSRGVAALLRSCDRRRLRWLGKFSFITGTTRAEDAQGNVTEGLWYWCGGVDSWTLASRAGVEAALSGSNSRSI